MGNWREQLDPILARARVLAVPIGAGLFFMVYAAIGLAYLDERQEQDSIRTQIQVVDGRLRLAANQEPLEAVQARAQAVTDAIPAGPLFPDQDVFPVMRRLAPQWGVSIRGQRSADPGSTKVGGNSYRVYPFTVTVEGSYVDVMNFVAVLESQDIIPTLTAIKATVTASGTSSTAVIDYTILTQAS